MLNTYGDNKLVYYSQKSNISLDFIKLFNKDVYEPLILSIMNLSQTVFPEKYERIIQQPNGECDFISMTTGEKFDAKLPFLEEQIKLLTNGKKHPPLIREWLEELQKEATEFQPIKLRESPTYVESTKLYRIIRKAVLSDKEDESLVFFIPFPIVPTIPHPILDLTSNFLYRIYDALTKECTFEQRSIFVIHPSTLGNELALRNLKTKELEYMLFTGFEDYFSYSIHEIYQDT